MNYLFKYVFFLLKNLTLLFYYFFLSWIPVNYIFGGFLSSKLTLLQGSYMAIWKTSSLGKIFSLYKLFFSGGSIFSILYKLPSITSIVVYLFLQQKTRKSYFLYALFMAILLLLFVGVFKQTIWYTVPWIMCIIYALTKMYTGNPNSFDVILLTTWAGQAAGTVSYALLKGFLTTELYIATIPVVFFERFLFIFTHYLTLYLITFTNKLYNQIQDYIVIKRETESIQ